MHLKKNNMMMVLSFSQTKYARVGFGCAINESVESTGAHFNCKQSAPEPTGRDDV